MKQAIVRLRTVSCVRKLNKVFEAKSSLFVLVIQNENGLPRKKQEANIVRNLRIHLPTLG